MIRAAERDEEGTTKLRITAYEALITLIGVSPNDCVISQYPRIIETFIIKLDQSFDDSVRIFIFTLNLNNIY